MGGEKETKVSAKKSTKSGSAEIGELRIHENKGEIHFHDDAKSLKCAVPVATWFAAWQRLWKEVNTEFNFYDVKNKTLLFASVIKRPGMGGKPTVQLNIYVEEVDSDTDESLTAMLKFMEE